MLVHTDLALRHRCGLLQKGLHDESGKVWDSQAAQGETLFARQNTYPGYPTASGPSSSPKDAPKWKVEGPANLLITTLLKQWLVLAGGSIK